MMLSSKGEGSQAQILHLIPIQWPLRPVALSPPLDSRGLLRQPGTPRWYLSAIDPKPPFAVDSEGPKAGCHISRQWAQSGGLDNADLLWSTLRY